MITLIFNYVKPNFKELFTEQKQYKVLDVSPNKEMVSIITDQNTQCQVVLNGSIYGIFEIIQNNY